MLGNTFFGQSYLYTLKIPNIPCLYGRFLELWAGYKRSIPLYPFQKLFRIPLLLLLSYKAPNIFFGLQGYSYLCSSRFLILFFPCLDQDFDHLCSNRTLFPNDRVHLKLKWKHKLHSTLEENNLNLNIRNFEALWNNGVYLLDSCTSRFLPKHRVPNHCPSYSILHNHYCKWVEFPNILQCELYGRHPSRTHMH